ncbi:MAG: hypothetical protein PVF50_12600, partial [Gammaproteobacteria bacterium]
MKRFRRSLRDKAGKGFSALFTILWLTTLSSQAQDMRAEDERFIWDLSQLFASVQDWELERDHVLDRLGELEARRGTLSENAGSLYRTLALV